MFRRCHASFNRPRARASLDITKPSSGNSGAAGVSSATSTSGLDPAGVLAVVFIVMALFWFLTRHWEGRKSPPASIHRICLVIFCGAGFLSVIDSADITFSILTAKPATATMKGVSPDIDFSYDYQDLRLTRV